MTSTPEAGRDPIAPPVISGQRRAELGRRAQWLAGASVAYNAVEATVAIAAGAAASSIALVGFGLDSIVEMSSGLIILWQFRHPMPETRERRALRLIALSFFALAGYVTVESLRSLLGGPSAEPSPVGIAIAALSLLVMPALSWAQRRTGQQLGSTTVVADSKQTLLCTYLSGVLLRRAGAELRTGLVVGRPRRGPGRRRTGGPRRQGGMARPGVHLHPGPRPCGTH